MLITFITISLFLFLYGLYCVHVIDKSYGLVLRSGAVILTITGLLLFWSVALFYSPVINNQTSRVVGYSDNWLMIEAHYNRIRQCKSTGFNVIFIKDNTKLKLSSVYSYSYSPNSTIENANVLVTNIIEMKPESFYIEAVHTCPFNIEITTKFPPLSLEGKDLPSLLKLEDPTEKRIAFIYIVGRPNAV
jgi:hypothetical protein